MEGETSSTISDSITLEIEGTKIHCSRTDLTKNSDYFKAMFENDFSEKNQDVIVLKDVKPEAMKLILKLIHIREFPIADENVLSVLEASCMLQFLQVKKICLEQVNRIMQANNCISIWVLAEHLDLKELCCKAKLLALLEFMFIKETEEESFLQLTLDLILTYLGNVNLQCTNEFYVYEVLNIWYEKLENKAMNTLYKLLHCVNYAALTINEMNRIINNEYVSQFESIRKSLQCVKAIKSGEDLFNFKDEYVELANKLMNAKNRNLNGLPCVLINNAEEKQSLEPTVLYYDKYKRKRKYSVLEITSNNDYFILYCDFISKSLKKLFAIGVTEKLEGFKMLGHRNFVFIFGGEFQIGQGIWNYDFHIFDTIKEIWTKKRYLYPRRHFESCICGNKVFIVGGAGPYRVIQKNMFWYDLETEEFSSLESLPGSAIQIKCCPFQHKLFILNINSKRGYLFNSTKRVWTTLKIVDNDEVLPTYSERVTVFNYKDSIFIKENNLYELKVKDGELVITNMVQLSEIQNSNIFHAEAVLINDTLYTLNKEWVEATNGQTISLEIFNVNTKERSVCFQKKNDEALLVNDEKFRFRLSPLTIFSMFHPNLIVKNDLINPWTC